MKIPEVKVFVVQDVVKINDEERKKKLKKFLSRVKALVGITLGFMSSLFFISTGIIVQKLGSFDPALLSSFRFAGILIFTLPILVESKENPFGTKTTRHLVFLRGVLNATSLYLRYYALQILPIAEASVIAVSMPVFVCLFARLFLKENFGRFHTVALLITFAAIGLTVKVHEMFSANCQAIDLHQRLIGIGTCAASVVLGALGLVIVRKVKGLHHSVILFNFAWISLCEMLVIAYFTKGFHMPVDSMTAWFLTALAIFSFYDQYLLTKALQIEEAGLVVMMRSSGEIVFAFILQTVIFHNVPDCFNVSGAILVTITVMLTSIRKYVQSLSDNSVTKKILGFITK